MRNESVGFISIHQHVFSSFVSVATYEQLFTYRNVGIDGKVLKFGSELTNSR